GIQQHILTRRGWNSRQDGGRRGGAGGWRHGGRGCPPRGHPGRGGRGRSSRGGPRRQSGGRAGGGDGRRGPRPRPRGGWAQGGRRRGTPASGRSEKPAGVGEEDTPIWVGRRGCVGRWAPGFAPRGAAREGRGKAARRTAATGAAATGRGSIATS